MLGHNECVGEFDTLNILQARKTQESNEETNWCACAKILYSCKWEEIMSYGCQRPEESRPIGKENFKSMNANFYIKVTRSASSSIIIENTALIVYIIARLLSHLITFFFSFSWFNLMHIPFISFIFSIIFIWTSFLLIIPNYIIPSISLFLRTHYSSLSDLSFWKAWHHFCWVKQEHSTFVLDRVFFFILIVSGR